MACEDCDWPVEGNMSHIVDSVYIHVLTRDEKEEASKVKRATTCQSLQLGKIVFCIFKRYISIF